MSHWQKKLQFEVPAYDALAEKICAYFASYGFKIVDTTDEKIKLRGGSFLSGIWTLNPLQWATEINISIIDREVKAEFSIDTAGQLLTVEEENLWNTFIGNFKLHLTSGIDHKAANKAALHHSRISSLQYIGWAITGGLAGGLLALVARHYAGIHHLNSPGIAFGAVALLTWRIKANRKRVL